MTGDRGTIAGMRLSLAAIAVAGLALLLFAITGPGYRIGLFSLDVALLSLMRWAAYVGAAGVVVSAVAIYTSRRHQQRAALAVGIVALVASCTGAAVPFQWQRRAATAPPIHDISTDLQNPPAFAAIVPLRADAPNRLDRPAAVNEQQRQGYPDIQPATLESPPDRAFDAALQAAQALGWEIVSADKSKGLIEATDTTAWFGFTDDVVVRLTPWGAGTRVDVRSVSRVGASDLGTNARRIEEYLDAIQD
jgi:uncharacterized protein (DUF1499 family)